MNLPHLDMEYLATLVSPDKPDIIRSLLCHFVATANRCYEVITSDADSAKVTHALHEWKGAAASIGASRIAVFCAMLEQAQTTELKIPSQLALSQAFQDFLELPIVKEALQK